MKKQLWRSLWDSVNDWADKNKEGPGLDYGAHGGVCN